MPLTKRDRQRLADVHPDLVRIVERVAAAISVDFMVVEGSRTLARQKELFGLGKSRTMDSRHLPKIASGMPVGTLRADLPAAVSHAVDLAPLVDLDGDGGLDLSWEPEHFEPIADAMKAAAAVLGIPIVWGGDWLHFRDMPHFELDRRTYP